jgi:hypothetical protein
MRRKCLDSPSDRGRWCFYAVSQSLSFAGLSRSASIAAFLAGVSHTAFGCCAARPRSRNSAMTTFFPAVLG